MTWPDGAARTDLCVEYKRGLTEAMMGAWAQMILGPRPDSQVPPSSNEWPTGFYCETDDMLINGA